MQVGTLILLSGKMGAGKSTKSKQVAFDRNAVLISEDEWLSILYSDQIKTFDDYIHYSSIIKPLVKSHVVNILRTGVDVVMDFPANTTKQRSWFKGIIEEGNALHELIYLKVTDEICLERIEKRRIEQPKRAMYDTEEMFNKVTEYFQEPNSSEGFNIKVMEKTHNK